MESRCRTHAQFFKWGIPSVLLVQLFPLVFVLLADKILVTINESIMSGASSAADISWTKMMLAGPLFLVVGFAAAVLGGARHQGASGS